jgi:hypothetical protein
MILAGILNACMDVLQFKFNRSIFRFCKNQQWVNPEISSQNKWKYDENGIWTGKEKFFGSSTFLVWLTDFWHFCKFLMLISISAAVIFYTPLVMWWADILIMYCAFTIMFELCYSKLFVK